MQNWQIIQLVNEKVLINDEDDLNEMKSEPRDKYDFGVKLLTDPSMLEMIENGIRGGYSGLIGDRYVKANNKFLPDYDPNKKSSYLQYIDANNLYGWCMMQKLPYSDWEWITYKELKALYEKKEKGDKNAIKYFKTHSFIWEVDLEYTDEAKLKTWKYPLAPVSKKVNDEDLHEWQRNYKKDNHISSTEKLILDLHNKKNYIVHDRVLDFYLEQGLELTKIHRIISFKEESWLKPYIEFNTAQRTIATTDFEKDIYKLMNNSFFGKTCENVRNRSDITLHTDAEEVMRLHRRCNYMSEIIFSEDLTAIQMRKTRLYFNKPIFVGMVVLDEAKRCMYETFYYRVLKVWPNASIIGGDTDSLVLYIESDDIYKDMSNHKNLFDLSDYPKDNSSYFKLKTDKEKEEYRIKYKHLFTTFDNEQSSYETSFINEIENCFLYSEDNKKVPGIPKDEELGCIIQEFVYLRAKQYCYSVLGKKEEKKRLKGITKNVVKKKISMKKYKEAVGIGIKNPIRHSVNMLQIQSELHEIYIKNMHKKALDIYDDKRFICSDKITTFPFGIESVADKIIYEGKTIKEWMNS